MAILSEGFERNTQSPIYYAALLDCVVFSAYGNCEIAT
jgi:hypothetical protein